MFTLNNNCLMGSAVLACLYLSFYTSDYMLLVEVLEGINCGSLSDIASLLPNFSNNCWFGSIIFLFFPPPTVLSIISLAKLFSREEKILLGNCIVSGGI